MAESGWRVCWPPRLLHVSPKARQPAACIPHPRSRRWLWSGAGESESSPCEIRPAAFSTLWCGLLMGPTRPGPAKGRLSPSPVSSGAGASRLVEEVQGSGPARRAHLLLRVGYPEELFGAQLLVRMASRTSSSARFANESPTNPAFLQGLANGAGQGLSSKSCKCADQSPFLRISLAVPSAVQPAPPRWGVIDDAGLPVR